MHGVLTLAGEGSRMLPWSRGLRKEFLPLFDRSSDGQPVLKPVANLVFETLLESGIDDFILVVGGPDGGVTAQNYFTVDREFLERNADRAERLSETTRLYEALSRSRIRFAVQPRPLGFGDAVLYAAPFVGADPFVLHAADAVLLERKRGRLPTLMAAMRERDDLDVVLLVRKVAHPQNYGVVEGKSVGRVEDFRRLAVTGMEEKPAKPRSQWAATAVYCLTSRIFGELNQARSEDPEKELELTTGIVRLIQAGARVEALVINPRFAEWRSVGSPEGYARALNRTRRIVSGASSFFEPVPSAQNGERSTRETRGR
jgi:UTP--glucose-1-phosphate uridylyltransferase